MLRFVTTAALLAATRGDQLPDHEPVRPPVVALRPEPTVRDHQGRKPRRAHKQRRRDHWRNMQ